MENKIIKLEKTSNYSNKKQRKPRYSGWWPESKLTPEITAKWDIIEDSIQEWGDYFSNLYGTKNAEIILYNITAIYSQKTRNPSVTIDEALKVVSPKKLVDIIFRVTNNLPCEERDTGQLEQFLKEANQCKN